MRRFVPSGSERRTAAVGCVITGTMRAWWRPSTDGESRTLPSREKRARRRAERANGKRCQIFRSSVISVTPVRQKPVFTGCRTCARDGTLLRAMTNTDVQKVRSHLATLEGMLEKRFGDAADEEALLEFRRVCWAALLLV